MIDPGPILPQLAQWLTDATERHALGDHFYWHADLLFAELRPGQQSPPPQFLVVMCLATGALGQYLQAQLMLPNVFELTEDDVDSEIAELMEKMRRARSSHLTSALATSPETNGQGIVPPELVRRLLDK